MKSIHRQMVRRLNKELNDADTMVSTLCSLDNKLTEDYELDGYFFMTQSALQFRLVRRISWGFRDLLQLNLMETT